MRFKSGYFALLSILLAIPVTPLRSSFPEDPKRMELNEWIKGEQPIALRNMIRNISAPGSARGAVVASPSKSDPNYFYHWIRDAAVVMDVIVDQYLLNRKGDSTRDHFENILFDYIAFSKRNQDTPNLSGGLGEPKFNADGSAYNESWGRPQDDGPALRAVTLMRLGNAWLNQGKLSLVREKLYDGNSMSLVKRDLEYVSHHWRNTSFELWEEVKGHHFHTRMVQRRSMVEGAAFAKRLNDFAAADWYRKQAEALTKELDRHWVPSKGILAITLDRDDGLDYKHSQLDSAIILGALHGHTEDGIFSYGDDRIVATAQKLEDSFYHLYSINRNGQPGVAIGRYPEDKYDGFNGGGLGNPWFINTAAFAEYYFLLAREIERRGHLEINFTNASFYQRLGVHLEAGQSLKASQDNFVKVVRNLRAKGDAFLTRVKFHIDENGSLSEQINRDSGFMQGARDLTWSYAALLTAINHRP